MLYQVNKYQIELFKNNNFKKPRLRAGVQVWRASLFAGAPSLWVTCIGETATQIR